MEQNYFVLIYNIKCQNNICPSGFVCYSITIYCSQFNRCNLDYEFINSDYVFHGMLHDCQKKLKQIKDATFHADTDKTPILNRYLSSDFLGNLLSSAVPAHMVHFLRN